MSFFITFLRILMGIIVNLCVMSRVGVIVVPMLPLMRVLMHMGIVVV